LPQAITPRASHIQAVLTEIYIEALLVDEELADQVWDAGEIHDLCALVLWAILSIDPRPV